MENHIIFKDEEESDFVCAGVCIGIIIAAVGAISNTTVAITKKKRSTEAAIREARMKFYEQLASINEQRKLEKKKKITTEALAATAIVLVILVMVLLYKFTFAITAKN